MRCYSGEIDKDTAMGSRQAKAYASELVSVISNNQCMLLLRGWMEAGDEKV